MSRSVKTNSKFAQGGAPENRFPQKGNKNIPSICVQVLSVSFREGTPPKTNIEPENGPLEEFGFLLETIIFRFHVNFWGVDLFRFHGHQPNSVGVYRAPL